MPDSAIRVAVQAAALEPDDEVRRLRQTAGSDSFGALVTFTGVCRSEDGRLSALELDHYPGMAEAELERIAGHAADKWPLAAITIVHRFGRVPVGEDIVFVATASRHRDAAFSGATFLMDFLKTRAPFWKKEHFRDGRAGGWVAATANDDAATERWR